MFFIIIFLCWIYLQSFQRISGEEKNLKFYKQFEVILRMLVLIIDNFYMI